MAKTSYEEWAKVSSNKIRPLNHLLLFAVVGILAACALLGQLGDSG